MSRKRIAIFPVMAGRRAGGVETYEVNLVRALAALDQTNDYQVFCTDDAASAAFGVEQANFRFHVLRPGWRAISITAALPWQLRRFGAALLHATYIPPPVSPLPYIFSMHDTSVFQYPEFYHARHRLLLRGLQRLAMRKARLVLCASQTTRNLVAEHFRTPDERLAVVPIGVGDQFFPRDVAGTTAVMHSYGIRRPYVLFVGQLRTRHKNLLRLLEAFHEVRHEGGQDLLLVLAGKRSWTTELLDETIVRLRLEGHVLELGHLPDSHLPFLYSGAEMLAFPSLSEGFGCAVTEAMSCGTPVVASNIPALRETGGDAVLFVDPFSVQDIAAGMHKVLRDSALRGRLREKGIERARQFTWRRCALETRNYYQSLSGH